MSRMVRSFLAILLLQAGMQGATLYQAFLDGSQEVPPRATPGSGVGFANLDGVLLDTDVSWQNLTAPTIAGHIHCCAPPGANAPVAIPFPALPSLVSGTYSNVFDLDNPATYDASFLEFFGGSEDAARQALVQGMNGGNAYFNLHTSTYPAGEIRGNISVVPEVSTFPLALAGLAGLALVARARGRKRRLP